MPNEVQKKWTSIEEVKAFFESDIRDIGTEEEQNEDKVLIDIESISGDDFEYREKVENEMALVAEDLENVQAINSWMKAEEPNITDPSWKSHDDFARRVSAKVSVLLERQAVLQSLLEKAPISGDDMAKKLEGFKNGSVEAGEIVTLIMRQTEQAIAIAVQEAVVSLEIRIAALEALAQDLPTPTVSDTTSTTDASSVAPAAPSTHTASFPVVAGTPLAPSRAHTPPPTTEVTPGFTSVPQRALSPEKKQPVKGIKDNLSKWSNSLLKRKKAPAAIPVSTDIVSPLVRTRAPQAPEAILATEAEDIFNQIKNHPNWPDRTMIKDITSISDDEKTRMRALFTDVIDAGESLWEYENADGNKLSVAQIREFASYAAIVFSEGNVALLKRIKDILDKSNAPENDQSVAGVEPEAQARVDSRHSLENFLSQLRVTMEDYENASADQTLLLRTYRRNIERNQKIDDSEKNRLLTLWKNAELMSVQVGISVQDYKDKILAYINTHIKPTS